MEDELQCIFGDNYKELPEEEQNTSFEKFWTAMKMRALDKREKLHKQKTSSYNKINLNK